MSSNDSLVLVQWWYRSVVRGRCSVLSGSVGMEILLQMSRADVSDKDSIPIDFTGQSILANCHC